jgi:hypothetical protein
MVDEGEGVLVSFEGETVLPHDEANVPELATFSAKAAPLQLVDFGE